MPRLLLLACVALLGASSPLLADDKKPAEAAKKPAPSSRTAAQEREHQDLLRKYDRNKNGRLDPDEWAQIKKDRRNASRFMSER